MSLTTDQIAIAKSMWAAGKTAKQIALKLNVTRGQICGMSYRGKWSRSEPARVDNPNAETESPPITIPAGIDLPTDAKPVCLIDAKPWNCRYIIGEPKGAYTIFCGAMVVGGAAWCPYHTKLVYTPRPARRQR
jgi:hypothetical protein